MRTIVECHRNLDFNTLEAESFAYMLKGDIEREKKSYEKEYKKNFDRYAKVEIDYDFSPQPIARTIHFDDFIEQAKNAFESLKESKNFSHAEGWDIEYDVNDRTKNIRYGIAVSIRFDEEYEKVVKQNIINKAKDISVFTNSLKNKGE